MKNKLKLILVGILSLVLVTGCSMKTNIHMDIKANQDVTISMTMAMDDELIDTMINSGDGSSEGTTDSKSNITDKQRWEYVEKTLSESDDKDDWTKEKYDKDGFKGYTYISKTVKLDDLTGEASKKFDFFGKEKIDDAKLFVKNGSVYKSNFSGDMKNDSSLGNSSSYSSSMDLFEVTFSVTLPNKPVKHNATTVSKDGKTLTWDLTKEADIQFEFRLGPNYLLYGGIAVAVIVVIAVITIISKSVSKKKDKPSVTPAGDKPVAQPLDENKNLEPTNDVPAESKGENSLQAMYNEPVSEVKEESKVEDSLQDMYNTQVTAAEEPVAPQPVEEAPAPQLVEEAPVAQPVEEAPAAQPVEEAPAAQPVEEAPAAQPVEEAPAAQPVEDNKQ